MNSEEITHTVDLSNMTLRSFRFNPKKGETSYSITIPTEFGDRDFHSPRDARRPHPDLIKALNKLGATLAKYDETKASDETPIEVLGITIADSDDREGYKLTGRQAYKRSHGHRPMNPPLRFDTHPDSRQEYTKAEVELIDSLIVEVRLYILGKTGELELFTEDRLASAPGGDTVPHPDHLELVGGGSEEEFEGELEGEGE